MINKINKKAITLIIVIFLICIIFILFKNYTTKLDTDEEIEVDGYKISYNKNPGEYKGELRVPMRVENMKNKDNPINPDKTFKLIIDDKETQMVTFSNESKYVNGTSFSPRITVSLDIVYEIKNNPKSYKLQIHDNKLLKDKVYEYDITPDITRVDEIKRR